MISLYSGTPGSGKSLHASQVIKYHLRFYSNVIGTFHINTDCLYKNSKYEYTYINIYSLTPKFLVDYAKSHKQDLKRHVEGSFLLVIDESQRLFNSRTWNNKDRNEWITFFAEHRHLGFDIILIAQNDRMLDRQKHRQSDLQNDIYHQNLKKLCQFRFLYFQNRNFHVLKQ